MKHSLSLATAFLIYASANSAGAATYLPTGPQTNIPLATVTGGGWTLCYQATFGTPFGNDASALSACNGDRLLLAGRETGSSTLLLLAQTTRVDALFDTGAANNGTTHLSDGSEWYFANTYSWGFAPAGASVSKTQCDTLSGAERLCVHTFDNVGGYRIGDIDLLNESTAYEKLVFTDSAVPEPATWALMTTALGLAGLLRRRATRSVTPACANLRPHLPAGRTR